MKLFNLNKTQYKLIYNLYNGVKGSYKLGWTLNGDYLSLQKLTDINQALGLSEDHPDLFETVSHSYRLVTFRIKDLTYIPELLNYNKKHEV